MEVMKFKGRSLTDDVMKSVKGGHVTTKENVKDLKVCDGCGFPIAGMEATPVAGVGYSVQCPNCQSIINVDVTQEED